MGVKGLHFGLCPELKSAFCFWLQAKKKKRLVFIRANPRQMLYRFNPCPQRPQCKILFFSLKHSGNTMAAKGTGRILDAIIRD